MGVALSALTLTQWVTFGVISGIAGGLVGGLISGGVKGALLGAAFGAIGRALFGAASAGLYALHVADWGVAAILGGIGASVSAATGGWKGLVMFGVGMLGAMAGGFAASGSKSGNKYVEEKPNGDNNSVTGTDGSAPGDEIAKNPKVRAGMEKAFGESGDNFDSYDNVHEQGGWILKDGKIVRWPEGTPSTIEIPSTIPKNTVGYFHTHPYTTIEGFNHMPSPADINNAADISLPGFVIDRISIMRIDPSSNSFHNVLMRY